MKSIRKYSFVVLALSLMLVIGAVSAQDVTIRYWLWDTNQLPPYQTCANNFMAENPGITVEVDQLGWDDYWTGITTGFVSGDAPDVFTNHLAKYPEFVELGQIYDIQPWVERDGVATDIYYPGLADLWTKDGARYGLPKDWDTVAVIYNVAMVEAAGIDPAIFDSWTWNYEDGGDFEQVIAQLSIDANGNNGLSADFDKDNVVQYGYGGQVGNNPYGQTEWSMFTNSTGWVHNNGTWGDTYFYDDERFINTIQWWADLSLEKGYMPPYEDRSGLGSLALFQAQTLAMNIDGSWMIGSYLGSDFEVGFARLPAGPEGRKSMFNGLADSIYVGTDHPEEAWAWVKYLASEACQTVVGESGVVFPAIPSAADLSLQVRADNGIDVSAFTEQAAEEGGTFLFPITDYAGEINTIMTEAMDAVMLGQATAADILPAANDEVNSLF
ncbi:MAG: sugar ABC transporter substrate-binding protein [Chloroflexi bacterium]|nr:sugar ABC transporter substrate-binding protein [Chloroflexota bacterium]